MTLLFIYDRTSLFSNLWRPMSAAPLKPVPLSINGKEDNEEIVVTNVGNKQNKDNKNWSSSLELRCYSHICVGIQQEMFLYSFCLVCATNARDCHHRKSHLQCPSIHDSFNIHVGFLINFN